MKIETKGQAMEILNNSIPYSFQIKNIDLEHDSCIYFTWRSYRYKLELDPCNVMMVNGGLLEGNDSSILMEHLIKNGLKELMFAKQFSK